MRLRAILFVALFFVAALPGLSAIFLRVYENTLVRQTEAELVAQGAALAAMAEATWPGASGEPPPASPDARDTHRNRPYDYQPETTQIDLSTTPVWPERPAAVPAATLPLDAETEEVARRLAPVIVRTTRTTLASVAVIDRYGRVVWGFEQGGSQAALPEVGAALAGRPATVLRRNGAYQARYAFEWLSRASALRIHHARPVVVDGETVAVLLLSRSPRALFRGIYEDRGKIMLGIAGIFLLLVLLSGLISRGITRPIEALSAASRDAAAGRGAIPETPPTAAVEIRALYDDYRAMAQAIDRRSRYLRDFAAAVSHEFKTPLAGIGGGVELLQDHWETMSAQERNGFLANMSADTARLTQLVTRLLDLARADMARPEAGTAVDPGPPVRQAADAFQAASFEAVLVLPADLPKVAVPAATLEAVVTALLENSRQAGARRAAITCEVDADALRLCIADDGPGVPQADRDRLFEPFFTSRRADGGTGLGLPIARSLLAASHGDVALAPSTVGASFVIVLPRAPQDS